MKPRAKNAERDLWIALDFHTRTGRNRRKMVAKDWKAFNLKGTEIANIASRFRRDPRRTEFEKVLNTVPVAQLRVLIEKWHRPMLCDARNKEKCIK